MAPGRLPRLVPWAGVIHTDPLRLSWLPCRVIEMNIITKEPQGLAGILGSGFSLFNAAFRQTWPLALGTGLLGSWWGGYAQGLGEGTWVQLERAPAWVILLAVACNLGAALLSLVMVRRIDNIARGLLPDLLDEFYVALHAFPGFVLASLIYGAIILLGLVVFVVPGLLLMVYFGFYGYAMVLEEQGPFKAMGRSFRLVEGQGAHPFFACLVTLLLVLAIALPLFIGLGALFMALLGIGAAATFPDWLAEALLGAAGNAMLEPLGIALSLSIYYELRVRKKTPA